MIIKIRHSYKDQVSGRCGPLCLLLIVFLGMNGFALAETGTQGPAVKLSLEELMQEPRQYLGLVLVVEGVLEAQGKGSRPPFQLRSASGAAVKVSPWAPLEIYHPREGAAKVKSMAYFVGRRLRLTGRLMPEGGKFILQVTSAEEL
ncbi:MAG: hypothetical protein PHX53_06200 [Syntrophales bacterium]|nr:hypothetical protein [Syntrophales bacterium]